jgi:hypothetical protein
MRADRGICRSSLHRVTKAKSATMLSWAPNWRRMMVYVLYFTRRQLQRLSAFLLWTRSCPPPSGRQ